MGDTYPYEVGPYRREGCVCEWERRGLLWQYGYNHEEAIRCYMKSLEADPSNAFAAFGVAYCVGPNYNKPLCAFEGDERSHCVSIAHTHAARAASLANTPLLQSLAAALQARFPSAESTPEEMDANNKEASRLFEKAHREFPDDLDVMAFYAESVMLLRPWGLWDTATGEPAFEETLKAKRVLEEGIAKAKASGIAHPGLLHYYIHCMELSKQPGDALEACFDLEDSCPDLGHLTHMPSHIYIQVGRYREAVESNRKAVVADMKYLKDTTPGRGVLNFYSVYRFHDLHFMAWAAMFRGCFADAWAASEGILDTPTSALTSEWEDQILGFTRPPLADWFEGLTPTYLHVLVRFGMWEKILEEKAERWSAQHNGGAVYTSTLATLHYARGVAHASLSGRVCGAKRQGHLEAAREEQRLFKEAVAYLNRETPNRLVMNNKVSVILQVAAEILEGEVLFREGDLDGGLAHLVTATKLDDGGVDMEKELVYDEPWGWMMPARHPLGALALEAGRLEQAEEAYKQDLGLSGGVGCRSYPDNIWSLTGLLQVRQAMGHSDTSDLDEKVRQARGGADVDVFASCLCKC
eukprot:TRINITY_DN11160_c0_g2_i1.p1 TRINITY_DN11160_c0_g2~~TRINITY_DN11160_c0_g2_i1.p1  ORF type:complete len:587 (+),score=203.94 TRINITY_DN11160_c0_g2_i1:24-1763(+)